MPENQTCQSCGAALPEGAAFCTQCGASGVAVTSGQSAGSSPQAPGATPSFSAPADPTQIVTPQNDPTATWPATPPAAPPSAPPAMTPPPPMAPRPDAPTPVAAPQPAAPPSAYPAYGAGSAVPPPAAPAPAVAYPQAPTPAQYGTASYGGPAPVSTAGAGSPKPSSAVAAVLGVLGGAAMVVGAFLPYVKATSGDVVSNVSGMNATGDALAALVVGAVAIVVAAALLARKGTGFLRLLLLGGGIAGIALAGYDLYDISQKLPKSDEVVNSSITQIDVGMGVFVVLGGGVVLLLAALLVKAGKGPKAPMQAPAFGFEAAPVAPQPVSTPPVAPAAQPAPPAAMPPQSQMPAPPQAPQPPPPGTGSF